MNRYLMILISILLLSCNGEKDEIIAAYEELSVIIRKGSSENIYSHLDGKSKDYVDFLIDSTNQDYQKMKEFGSEVGYPLFTTIFHKKYSDKMKDGEDNLRFFILYLRFSEVPMFNAFRKSKLLEDQSKIGVESYVTVALEIAKNTYVSSKIFFVKEKEEYKFNLMGMLNFSEKILNQQFKKYVNSYDAVKIQGSKRSYKTGEKIDYPDDMLKAFLENMDKPENDLKTFRYKK